VRVVIADHHPVVREGIRLELMQHTEVNIIGEASNGCEAIIQALYWKPDVLVMDLFLPGISAVDIVSQVRNSWPATQIMILSDCSEKEAVHEMFAAGAIGYMLKDDALVQLKAGLRIVAKGIPWHSSTIRQITGGQFATAGWTQSLLSRREARVLQLLAYGQDNTEIAGMLDISVHTVRNHIVAIFTKIGVHSRAEAVAWAWRHGKASTLYQWMLS